MPSRSQVTTHAVALLAYAVVALLFAWPLPLHLSTHLTGPPTGDTAVYVWNQWVFRHELVEHHRLPYFTGAIFSLTGSDANLSLHNYTPFQNLLALPLLQAIGVVTTFNVVFLAMGVLTAYVTFLLTRHVTGATGESWLAGVLFAWSPVLVTRGMGHFSLVAATPLPAFLLLLLLCARTPRRGCAVALGAAIAWATTTDVYYGIYCLLIGAVFLLAHAVRVDRADTPAPRPVRLALDGLAGVLAGAVAFTVVTGGMEIAVAGMAVRMRTLYTPVLLLTCLVLLRVALTRRLRWTATADQARGVARATVVAGLTAAALLSPLLYAVAIHAAEGRFDGGRIFWRSSPGGVDLLALVTPNPNHPLAPDWTRGWLMPQSDTYLENVASLPLVAGALLVTAWARGWRPHRVWVWMVTAFGLLALGPFVHVAGVNTYVPGPWALLRYAPIVDLVRTPARFSVVLTLAFVVLCASALAWLRAHDPARRRLWLAGTGLLLALELVPAPRTLYSAEVPRFFARVAAEPGDGRLLDLPFGVRDGTSNAGNFSARSMFFQTAHAKPLIGGYLSRVSSRRVSDVRSDATLDALIVLSEGRALPPDRRAHLLADGPAFVRRARLGFVVVDTAHVSPDDMSLVVRAFRLERLDAEGPLELYRPTHD